MIVATGNCAVDYILKVPKLPGHDEKVIATELLIAGGSPAPNFACAAAKLGNKAAFIGIVGNDSNGAIIQQDLLKYGVETRLQVIEGLTTPITVIIVDDTGEKSLVISPNPIARVTTAEFFPETSLYGAKHLHTHLFPLDHVAYVLKQAKNKGLTSSIDLEPSSVTALGIEAVLSLLNMVDIVFVNLAALFMLAYDDDLNRAVSKLAGLGPQIILATAGSKGTYGYDKIKEELIYVPAYQVKVVDTSGAGDCFAAAFISEYLATKSVQQACNFASAAAALSITRFGIRNSYPTKDEVERFMHESKK